MRRAAATVIAIAVLAGACAGDSGPNRVTVYTSVTQETVDAVLDVVAAQHPDLDVVVVRAPTGELTARLAAEARAGGVRADVLWLTDPLSMIDYESDGTLRAWQPDGADMVPAWATGERHWGTRVLAMVLVHHSDVQAPRDWDELAHPRYRDRVVLPDPGFAGSALAVVGFFATAGGDDQVVLLRDLHANGAVTVPAPGEVVTAVAEGRFDVGVTLAYSAAAAVEAGSPLEIVVPPGGAIALYSPIAVTSDASNPSAAERVVESVLSFDGQSAIAATGWQPIRDDVRTGPRYRLASVDWIRLAAERDVLLADFRSIFGE